MIIDPIYLIFSHITAGAIGIATWNIVSFYESTAKAAKRLKNNPSFRSAVGLVTEDIPPTVMSTEQYTKYLKKTYSEAWENYNCSYSMDKPIAARTDTHILRLILETEEGKLTATKDSHTIDFSNGDSVWIANKYYGYGQMYGSVKYPHLRTNTQFRLSPYTFLRLVNFEETYFDSMYGVKPRVEIKE